MRGGLLDSLWPHVRSQEPQEVSLRRRSIWEKFTDLPHSLPGGGSVPQTSSCHHPRGGRHGAAKRHSQEHLQQQGEVRDGAPQPTRRQLRREPAEDVPRSGSEHLLQREMSPTLSSEV